MHVTAVATDPDTAPPSFAHRVLDCLELPWTALDWRNATEIGSGSFGVVYKVQCENFGLIAAKKLQMPTLQEREAAVAALVPVPSPSPPLRTTRAHTSHPTQTTAATSRPRRKVGAPRARARARARAAAPTAVATVTRRTPRASARAAASCTIAATSARRCAERVGGVDAGGVGDGGVGVPGLEMVALLRLAHYLLHL